jgi:hypothetical protein
VRQEKYAQQTICLSCANIKTRGKLFVCHVFIFAVHPKKAHGKAKKNAHNKDRDARQTSIFL